MESNLLALLISSENSKAKLQTDWVNVDLVWVKQRQIDLINVPALYQLSHSPKVGVLSTLSTPLFGGTSQTPYNQGSHPSLQERDT